ncbi:Alpha/Beta hydrolase protein [Mycena belliarum]|uniref:Alpha/Beta hydrolase protein n=1 Tax=Mycena belliarum TaxID=1033014 RepID=A0AAD6UHI5_9AGAR|nr:Alpha/Beta hydrolase protein [Mycena belliae]
MALLDMMCPRVPKCGIQITTGTQKDRFSQEPTPKFGNFFPFSGHTWGYVDANPQGPTALLCLHGFPDLAYGYRHQIGPWARAGFRVVVPDMLGYGTSDAPVDPAQYTSKRLANDLVALLDALRIARAILIGHDWGAYAAGRVALWHPDRVQALVVMSVPYTPTPQKPMVLTDVVQRAPNLGYQLLLASPAAAPTIEANLAYFLSLMYTPPTAPAHITLAGTLQAALDAPAPDPLPPSLLKGSVLAAYLAAYRARGMTGPTNYYRTTHLRYREEAEASLALPPTLSVLFIYGTRDPTIAPAALKTQRRFAPRLTEVPLEGAGHWVMLEGSDDALFEGVLSDHDGEWWKAGTGDGGPVGREILRWLADLKIGRAKL